MPKPACIKCCRFLRPKHTGYYVMEGKPKATNAANTEIACGIENDAGWEDYKIWACDLWKCEGCGTEIIMGYGREPVAQNYMEKFEQMKEAFNVKVRINDC